VSKTVLDQELMSRGEAPLTHDEYFLLLSHAEWSIETAANMIMQLRRSDRPAKRERV
jgi:hypothetical protein